MKAKVTYGKISIKGKRIILSDVKPHVSIRLKSIFARIPKEQTKSFDLPFNDDMASDVLWFSSRFPFEISAKDSRLLKSAQKRLTKNRAEMEAILLPEWDAPSVSGFRDGFAPNHMQKQAIEVLKRRNRLLLGDDVGQGKTWVAMAAALHRRPAAVVVQAHLADQWAHEFITVYTELTCHIIDGTSPYSLPKADVYIFRYSNISGWSDIAATGIFSLVVYDEIQELRTRLDSAKGRAAKVFSTSRRATQKSCVY